MVSKSESSLHYFSDDTCDEATYDGQRPRLAPPTPLAWGPGRLGRGFRLAPDAWGQVMLSDG